MPFKINFSYIINSNVFVRLVTFQNAVTNGEPEEDRPYRIPGEYFGTTLKDHTTPSRFMAKCFIYILNLAHIHWIVSNLIKQNNM